MAEKDQIKAQRSRIVDMKNAFTTESGARVLGQLIKTYMMKSSYVPNDSHGTAFNEGARSVVLTILSNMKIDPNKITQMMEDGYDAWR